MSTIYSDNHQLTIAAIATPAGNGGVAIIRISGSNAIDIGNKIFSKDFSEFEINKLYYGQIYSLKKEIIDHGMAVIMKAPKSYTGEDIVEIHCHGGDLIAKSVLESAIKAGASIAAPGEFTQRAFLNKKMDLTQAEAVQNLISASNKWALKMAREQLNGSLSTKIKALQKRLIDQAAVLEAWVDFPEEGIEFSTVEEIKASLMGVKVQINQLLKTYENGRALRDGFSLCLLGRPNVGKSSLMNQLLQKDRAIVTSIAGTTRDLLEEPLVIEGVQYRLIDTAGWREASEEVEKIGIEKAIERVEDADLVLLVLDASVELQGEDLMLIEKVKEQKLLILWNKIDIAQEKRKQLDFEHQIELSAKTGKGIVGLYEKIHQMMIAPIDMQKDVHLTEQRHKDALDRSLQSLCAVLQGLDEGNSPEWVIFDLRESLKNLGAIIGFDITEDILSSIFSRFCIGK